MIHEAIQRAVEAVCEKDGMDNSYKNALLALIENMMLNSLDQSDIHNLLGEIDVEDQIDVMDQIDED